jgi:hypothetical protein
MEKIKDLKSLINLKKNTKYEIVNDIDCNYKEFKSSIFHQILEIEGNNFTIKNAIISERIIDENYNIGIFMRCNECKIQNVIFENIIFKIDNTLKFDTNFGILVSESNNSNFKNIKIVAKLDVKGINEISLFCSKSFNSNFENISLEYSDTDQKIKIFEFKDFDESSKKQIKFKKL